MSVSFKDIKAKIHSVLSKGDILFIIPPVATTKSPILGPLILQHIAQEKGFKAHILHMNLILASIIGLDIYEGISYGQPFRMMGERLFARSAYGLPPLGSSPELCSDPVASVFGSNSHLEHGSFEYKYYNTHSFNLETFFRIEEVCYIIVDTVIEAVASYQYKMIGCSSNWEQNNCSIAFINRIKQIRPDTITLLGGSNCEGEMAQGIAQVCNAVDYVFSGESENTFSAFCDNYVSGRLPETRIITGNPVQNQDSIPLPILDSFITQRNCFLEDKSREMWVINYETSRGCWWGKCNFCGLNGMGRDCFREKSKDKVAGELKELHNRYPGQPIGMVDKVMSKSFMHIFLPLLDEFHTVPPMSYEVRPDLTYNELLQLKKAGFISIKPGIESLSDGLLTLMNKGVTAAQNILLLRNAHSLGLYVDWNLLWGFPGDKKEYYEQTLALLPLLRHLCPPAVFRHISIDRFSHYFQEPGKNGISNIRPWNVYTHIYPGEADLSKIAYRFIGDYHSGAHNNPGLIRRIADEIETWKSVWKQTHLSMHPLSGQYLIVDNRKGNSNIKKYTVDVKQAKEIMSTCIRGESENREWAINRKLAVVINSQYIPLITAPLNLITELDEDCNKIFKDDILKDKNVKDKIHKDEIFKDAISKEKISKEEIFKE